MQAEALWKGKSQSRPRVFFSHGHTCKSRSDNNLHLKQMEDKDKQPKQGKPYFNNTFAKFSTSIQTFLKIQLHI